MKKLFYLFILLSFIGCKKCYTCKQDWTYQKMVVYDWEVGTTHYLYPNTYASEEFEVCGSDEAKEKEKGTTSSSSTFANHVTDSIHGVAVCHCTAK